MNEWIEQYKQYHREHSEYGNGGGLKFYLQHIKDLVQDKFDCDLVNYSGAIYSLRKRGYVSTNNHLHSLTEKGKLKAKGLMFE